MIEQPMAFMSYTHFDDENDRGYITKFCKKLGKEVQAQTGKEFSIFQDIESIRWGDTWRERICSSIHSVTFFIPIITPSFFKSENCRDELTQFIEHEKSLSRNDLILPIYYITCTQIENEDVADDKLVKAIKDHQMKDWRNLRKKSFEIRGVTDKLVNLAIEIRDAIGYPQKTIFEDPKKLTVDINNVYNEKDISKVKLMPRVLIVDKCQANCYSTNNEPIKDASPGDKILIHPGIYQEGLILNKPLDIIGEGMLDSIIVQAIGQSALLFKTDEGCVANLTFQQMGGGNWFCIDIAKGSLQLEGCDITSEGSACISIHDNANPIIRHNRIHKSSQSGILIFNRGMGILEYNEIYENTYAGIEIKKFGNPVLRHNIIRDGKQNGVLVYDSGRGTFENNDIFGNEFPQIAIFINGNPYFRNNKIHDGKQNGVIIFSNGLGNFEDNDIFSNEYPGVAVKIGGNPIFRHNRIYNNKQNGIFIYENGLGMYEDNDISGNVYPGVAIKIGGNPIFRHNRIYNNKQNGIFIYENGLGMYEDNDIFGNVYPGVAIKISGNPIFRHNRIYNNKQNGIYIFENGQGMFEYNDIFGNEYPGVAIGANSDPRLFYNRIHNGKSDGVLIEKNGKCMLESNDIFSNAKTGISIESGGNPMILGNRINKNSFFGISIQPGGCGVIEDNDLRNNKLGTISKAQDSLSKVRFLKNLEKDP
ncbi:MAG: right-handed parallel beta-helix repeat-containing protein [Methanothrix sp.]